MATSSEMAGVQNIIKSMWTEDAMMRQLGYKRVEGLSFWVRGESTWTRQLFGSPGHGYQCDRPFTKGQHRAYAWKQRKDGWVRRGREIRERFTLAWRALRGEGAGWE